MPVAAGVKLGPYEILAPVGEGGMGEVYRARDTRLNRSVAIKVLPEAIANDPDRMRRFEQEARTVAAINHPNILAVYDVGVQDGTPYLVTELLEGETLRERLDRGPVSARKSVEISSQIAHGLSAAHERGIVHRDLKPENIFLTKDGHTKLLDFGLAKATAAAAAEGKASSLTMQTVQTEPGVVMGTAPYMAPEQVRGELVDYRADIFSFGAVLYEMLCGKRAFAGDTSVEIMTAILKTDPPEFNPEVTKVPPALDRIVRHCLEKDPADRFQSARDLTFALGALSGPESSQALRAPVVQSRSWLVWALGAAAILLLGILAISLYFHFREAPHSARMEFAIPVQDEVGHIALSPDGSMLAYVAVDENSGDGVIFVQPVGSPNATRLNGTEGATYPFWSPKNDYVGFFAQGKLKKIPATGGVPQVLASATHARGGSWGKKDVILYSPESGGPLWRVDADGTDAAPVTDKSFTVESSHRWPIFLPDGDHFLFWSGNFSESPNDHTSGIYLSSLTDRQQKRLVTLARSNPGYARNRLFYVDLKGALVQARMDTEIGEVSGKPQIVASQVGRHPSTYWSAFTVSQNGTVVFHQRTGSSQSQLTWYDRTGKELGHAGDVGILANPSISPDGNRVVFDVADPNAKNIDVWIYDLPRNASTRFTFDPAEETTGVWSRDGKTIAYRSASNDQILRLKNSTGFEADQGLAAPPPGVLDIIPNSFAMDDKQLLATGVITSGGSNLQVVSLSDKKVSPFLTGRGNKADGQISPDGKWVAYESDETGEWEVYISPYSGGGGKLQVSRGGGVEPRWRGDGKEIFYLDTKGNLVSVSVNSEGSLSTGAPTVLFQPHARATVSSSDLFSYDVTPDGKRFLVDRYVKPAQTPPLNIILHAVAGRE
jgi:serine/threonine protein kinase/dipeptidyl aminopeptidase/acylaminoacyl peptidase